MAHENTTPPRLEIRERIINLLDFIKSDLREKDEAVRLALLAGIAGESIFFLGPPGTAKSMISRRLRYAFRGEGTKDLVYFEYLMNQFSTPDEIYGPVSLKALEENKYERITEGYLPNADIAFLDEIWKAGPAIQNTLLTIINEKKFHNGNEVVNVPLKVLVSASNELPAENLGLEALWDRFLIRVNVGPISNEEQFMDMICGGEIKTELSVPDELKNYLITSEDLKNWREKIDKIKVPDYIRTVITAIRQEMTLKNEEENRAEKEKFYVSDRRWRKTVHLLRTSAFLNGRDSVDLMDCQLITYCIWNTEKQFKEVADIVNACVEQHGLPINNSLSDIDEEIKIYTDYVNELFYTRAPQQEKMSDGSLAWVLTSPEKIMYNQHKIYSYNYGYTNNNNNNCVTVKYISEKYYYTPTKEKITACYPINVTISRENKMSWIDSKSGNEIHATIELNKVIIKNHNVFNTPDLLEVRQNKADEQYNSLSEKIKSETKKINNYKNKKSKLFKQNIFSDQKMRDIILTNVDKALTQLEKANSDLDKIRKKYS